MKTLPIAVGLALMAGASLARPAWKDASSAARDPIVADNRTVAPLLAINEDNDHFFRLSDAWISREGAERYADVVLQGPVTHFVMCVNGQRTSYDSKTWEPIWAGLGEKASAPTAADGTRDLWAVNAKKLVDAGVDVYAVWTARCRAKGVSPWVSMRMNDLHGIWDPTYFRNTNFSKKRRDLWRNPRVQNELTDWAFDYAKAEVRAYALSQFEEIATRWDTDGVELDWMRHGIHLRAGRERDDAKYLTTFMRDARAALDRISQAKGRKMKLAVRVPAHFTTAERLGYEIDAWLREGLIDMIVPTSFYMLDTSIPVADWKKRVAAANPDVLFLPCIDLKKFLPGKGSADMTLENYRAVAAKFQREGAEGVYLFNAEYLGTSHGGEPVGANGRETVFQTICREGLSLEAIAGKPAEMPASLVDFPNWASPPKDLPPLLKTKAGADVKTVADWENVRRPEIRETFLGEMYGRRPAAAEKPDVRFARIEPDAEAMDGKAMRMRVRCSYRGPRGEGSFAITAFVPKAGRPVPSFLLICNRNPAENIDWTRQRKSSFWPAEEIVRRGYAALAFYNGEIALDGAQAFAGGVFAAYERPCDRTERSWGVLSAWAWGASRVMDWIVTEPSLDAAHVAVVGHSRGGKTALLAGVTDPRFAMACVNDSGCCGTKLNAMDLPSSEHFDQILDNFAYWFCGRFATYRGCDLEAGFDQHQWAALMAPRLLAIGSASADAWAGPKGEYQCGREASPAWELYGRRGLVGEKFPDPKAALQEGHVSYHLRPGGHNLSDFDWKCYMDFADRHGWRTR